ncbi:MAG: hypothetical protein D6683_06870 [Actinomyces sp.]|nr:MAG: hypothetical protein D6683_06870 [Actinomyces sp.]
MTPRPTPQRLRRLVHSVDRRLAQLATDRQRLERVIETLAAWHRHGFPGGTLGAGRIDSGDPTAAAALRHDPIDALPDALADGLEKLIAGADAVSLVVAQVPTGRPRCDECGREVRGDRIDRLRRCSTCADDTRRCPACRDRHRRSSHPSAA